ncbi:MAG: NAD(+)/NADH kinase [Pirellulaceae bacterium]|jgi:NAD+ kinase|nr:NAD(+)/NADH kinase [Pirellulaceae bacterium]MDP7019672.1 NAD(+)/NADH kinase [Pirellulaceae bacterium]
MGAAPTWADRDRPQVLLLGAGDRPAVAENAEQMRAIVESHCDIQLVDFVLTDPMPADVEADFAVVLGGDGSMLRAGKLVRKLALPLLGVNLGRLGYLAPISPKELPEVLPAVCRGECQIVDHLMMRCRVFRGDEVLADETGLNEVAVLGGPPFSILDIDVYVDAELATTYSCDGLIISTPVGSTAHNLSAGGPILRNNLHAFVISPISPHTLTVRPVVDTADRVIEVVVREPNETTSAVVDGQVVCHLTKNDRVRVERSIRTFRTIEVPSQSYYRMLQEKLGWRGTIRGKRSN